MAETSGVGVRQPGAGRRDGLTYPSNYYLSDSYILLDTGSKELPFWEDFPCSHGGSMLAFLNAGYCKVQIKEVLGK